MRITGISFIGVDEETNFQNLQLLADKSEIPLEFGVLYSSNKSGTANKRYPSINFIKKFVNWYEGNTIKLIYPKKNFDISLHLCGASVASYLNNEVSEINYLSQSFDRIQLNFAMNSYTIPDLIKKFKEKSEYDTLVIQHNKSKLKLIDTIVNEKLDVDLLFDGSGGFGRVLENPLEPIPNYYCGYADGLGPDTINEILPKIYQVKQGDSPFYIDMESKIRVDNLLSIDKCLDVIEKATVIKKQFENDDFE